MAGALTGMTVIEIAGLGPAPFAAMMLADHGAHVLRLEKLDAPAPITEITARSRPSLGIDLKHPKGRALVQDLAVHADVFIEGFRPGVMERLGLGPEVLMERNSRLVYGRMTGWGQSGPLAPFAGHDINYIALNGALHAFGREGERPTPPMNLIGDYGGGAMVLAFGLLAGVLSAQRTGIGQVVDCAMVDGAALLLSEMMSFHAAGEWRYQRGVNVLDTGAPFYDVYETSDHHHIAIGPYEPQFFRELLERLDLSDDPLFDNQMDRSQWPAQRSRIAAVFKTQTRDQWVALLEATNSCATSVLSVPEASMHPHLSNRETFVSVCDVLQPAPAPRFTRTPPDVPTSASRLSRDFAGWPEGFDLDPGRLLPLADEGVIAFA